MPLRLRLTGMLSLCALFVAGHVVAAQADIAATLPDLPSPRSTEATRVDANAQGVTVGYAATDQSWGAQAVRPAGTETALQLTYGSILTDSLAAGVHVAVQPRQSEVVLNGIYDPVSDLRLHMAVGQLRSSNNYQFVFGEYAKTVAQSSYLLDLRKYWEPGSLLRDFGASVYQAGTRERGAEAPVSSNDTSERLATGKQQGYMLNLSLAPSEQSKLDFGQGVDRAQYGMAEGVESNSGTAVRQASFTQYWDNCLHVRGGYRTTSSTDEVQLDVVQGRWQIGLSRQTNRDGGDNATALKMGYSLPLGSGNRSVQKCRSKPHATAAFAPVYKAVTARPTRLPAEPLVQVETLVPPETNPLATAGNNGVN